MSFYRYVLTAVTSMALVASACVFADDTTTTTTNETTTATTPADVAPASSVDAKATTTTETSSTTTTTTTDKVDLNKATAKQLMKVKGMSASKAKAVVSYRKKHGDFKSVDDLKNVKG